MPKHGCLIGPPGVGKTEAGITLCKTWMDGNVDSTDIAYLAFTRAAAKEAAIRIIGTEGEISEDVMKERYPLFRTIHSLAFMGMKAANPDLTVITPVEMREFSKRTGYVGKFAVANWEDIGDVFNNLGKEQESVWDKALRAYTLSRVTATKPEDFDKAKDQLAPAARKLGYLEDNVYRTLVKRYEAFKKQEGLIDFTDMLEFAARVMEPLDHVKYVVADESQDLSGAHYLILEKIFRSAEQIWYIGDDDQSIFSFSGASPDLFIEQYRGADWRLILRKTHRFGEEIVRYSARIIKRVPKRIEKDIIGVAGRHGSIRFTGRFEPVRGSALILHRHVQGCQEVAKRFVEEGLPFRNERGKDPYGVQERVRAWQALDALAKGKKAQTGGVKRLIEDYMPSTYVDEASRKTQLIPRGGVKKASDLPGLMPEMSIADLIGAGILTEQGAEAIRKRHYRVFDYADDFAYYHHVVENGHTLHEARVPVITTIHGAKGRQADSVVVFNEMSRRCWQDADTEHRLAYVAATRTKGDLTICADRRLDWASSPYDYPESEEKQDAVVK